MSRYIGNYIRATSTEPTQNSSPGIWSLSDQLAYKQRDQWPIERDPYYNLTTLHLPGNVVGSGYQATTLPVAFNTDSSTNKFLVTPNGDVRANSFSPYQNNYSVYFDGTANGSLRADSTADTNLSGDFTIQAWVFPTANGQAYNTEIISRGAATTFNGWHFGLVASTTQPFFGINYAATAASVWTQSSTNIPLNQWTHLAVTRSGNTCRIYINGAIDTTNTGFSGTPTVSGTEYVYVGRASYDTTTRQFTGYISNASIIKGTALTTFSQTQPLVTSTSGQALLTCTANRFIDTNSATTAKTLTPGSGVSVHQNSPFVSYDTASGSGYFDGTGDYFTSASNIVDFAAGQAFTFECWVYVSSIATSQAITASGANTLSLAISGGQILYGKSGVIDLLVGTMVPANQWVHVAVGRNSSNTSRLWVNGTSVATSGSDTYSYNASTMYIGSNSSPASYLNGYMSNLRVIKGTDVYGVGNTNITVPTAPLTAVSGTSLLTLQTRHQAQNSGFLDTGPNNFVVTRSGNVTQGSFSPFSPSGWSVYFPGTGTGRMQFPSGNILPASASATWTIEFWVNPGVQTGLGGVIFSQGTTPSGDNGRSGCTINTSGILTFGIGETFPSFNSGTAIPYNQWTHVAITRNANTFVMFINGVSKTTVSSTKTIDSGFFRIGTLWDGDGNGAMPFLGYISNFRLINSVLYTNNFTPLTTALTKLSGTQLLTCQSNRFVDVSDSSYAVTLSGSPSIQAFSPFAPTSTYLPQTHGGSAYFDSSGDSFAITSSPALSMTGDFCMEAWAYPTTASITFAWKYTAGVVSTSEYFWAIDGTNQLSIALDGGGGEDYFRTAANTITLNAWNHCVITRVGTAVRMFINGVLQSYNTTSRTLNVTSTNFSTSGTSGYMSGLRIMRGSIPDLYQTTATTTGTTVFATPTAPVTATQNTSLLLNFTNAGIVDATGRNVLETVGNAHISTSVSKFSGGSMVFDGNGDYLRAPASNLMVLGTGDWTIECWVYLQTTSVQQIIFETRATGTDAGYAFYVTGSGKLALYTNNTSVLISSTSVPSGSWVHLAMTRAGSTIRGFINGTLDATTATYSSSMNCPGSILASAGQGGTDLLNGYLQDLRITKGVARYTTNFTPTTTPPLPTKPLPIG